MPGGGLSKINTELALVPGSYPPWVRRLPWSGTVCSAEFRAGNGSGKPAGLQGLQNSLQLQLQPLWAQVATRLGRRRCYWDTWGHQLPPVDEVSPQEFLGPHIPLRDAAQPTPPARVSTPPFCGLIPTEGHLKSEWTSAVVCSAVLVLLTGRPAPVLLRAGHLPEHQGHHGRRWLSESTTSEGSPGFVPDLQGFGQSVALLPSSFSFSEIKSSGSRGFQVFSTLSSTVWFGLSQFKSLRPPTDRARISQTGSFQGHPQHDLKPRPAL